MLHLDAMFGCYAVSLCYKFMAVSFTHVWETRTSRDIRTMQGVLRHVVDVVGDNHQVANLEVRIGATSSIADEKSLDTQFIHDPNGERDLLHRIALIIMEATLHGHHILAAKFSEDEFSGMALYCGYREVWDIAVGNRKNPFYTLCQLSKASAEHNSRTWCIRHPFVEPSCCFFYFLVHSL